MTISIIIPVYNAAKTISRTIDSIIIQDYHDWELILVNDGSTDESELICQQFVDGKKIRLYNQVNKGVSEARNRGLDYAIGKFIVFIDSDDEIRPSYLKDLYNDFILNNQPELIIQGFIKENKNGDNTINQFCNKPKFYLLEKNVDFFYNFNFMSCGFCFSKLFLNDVIKKNNIRFNKKITFCEDLVFLIQYISFCNKIYVSDKANYIYKYTENSLSTSFHSFELEYLSYQLVKDNYKKLLEKYNITGKEQLKLVKKNYSLAITRPLVAIVLNKKINSYSFKSLINQIDNEYFIILRYFIAFNKKYFMLLPFCSRKTCYGLMLVLYLRYKK